MKLKKMWMVRAGEGAKLIEEFAEGNLVAIGWHELGEIAPGTSREAVSRRVAERWPNASKFKVAASAGQIYRFLNEIEKGDGVVSYHPGRRVYLLGRIEGAPEYRPEDSPENYPRVRSVTWLSAMALT